MASSAELMTSRSHQYPPQTIKRAEQAMSCSPFRLTLFLDMQTHSVALLEIAGQTGCDRGYTHQPLAELAVENYLLWLIQVGVLRREVDGQGLTDSFRLTPLGRLLLETWQQKGQDKMPIATIGDRLSNFGKRWIRLPL